MLKDIIKEQKIKMNEKYGYSHGQGQIITETAQIVAREVLREINEFADKKVKIHLEIESTHSSYPKQWHEGNRNAFYDLQAHLQSLEESLLDKE
jgi:hypothetical protein